MIEEYVSNLAESMNIPLTSICISNVNPIPGSPDIHLLKLSSGEFISTALLWQSDLDGLQSGFNCDLLEKKVRIALEKLQILMAS
jgi:hypothetical protein